MGEGLREKNLSKILTYKRRERDSIVRTCMSSQGVRAQTQPNAADTKQGTKKHIKKISKNNEIPGEAKEKPNHGPKPKNNRTQRT